MHSHHFLSLSWSSILTSPLPSPSFLSPSPRLWITTFVPLSHFCFCLFQFSTLVPVSSIERNNKQELDLLDCGWGLLCLFVCICIFISLYLLFQLGDQLGEKVGCACLFVCICISSLSWAINKMIRWLGAHSAQWRVLSQSERAAFYPSSPSLSPPPSLSSCVATSYYPLSQEETPPRRL